MDSNITPYSITKYNLIALKMISDFKLKKKYMMSAHTPRTTAVLSFKLEDLSARSYFCLVFTKSYCITFLCYNPRKRKTSSKHFGCSEWELIYLDALPIPTDTTNILKNLREFRENLRLQKSTSLKTEIEIWKENHFITLNFHSPVDSIESCEDVLLTSKFQTFPDSRSIFQEINYYILLSLCSNGKNVWKKNALCHFFPLPFLQNCFFFAVWYNCVQMKHPLPQHARKLCPTCSQVCRTALIRGHWKVWTLADSVIGKTSKSDHYGRISSRLKSPHKIIQNFQEKLLSMKSNLWQPI